MLPKISIILPTIGNRPNGIKRFLKSLKRLFYPQELIELIIVSDSPRLGCPKRVNEGYRKSTGEWICFMADDTEFQEYTLINAVIEAYRTGKRNITFWSRGGVGCEHFIIKRDLVEKLGGEIFSEKFNHIGVDNLLWAKCDKLGEGYKSPNVAINHYHFLTETALKDETYEIGWGKAKDDRELLSEELAKI